MDLRDVYKTEKGKDVYTKTSKTENTSSFNDAYVYWLELKVGQLTKQALVLSDFNLKDKLECLAKKECWTDSEDFNPCEFSGGNYDDAYFGGTTDGKTYLAREILKEYYK
jgi:hypothetical protein